MSASLVQPTLLGLVMFMLLLAFLYLVLRAVLDSKAKDAEARIRWLGFRVRKGRPGDDDSPDDKSGRDVSEPGG